MSRRGIDISRYQGSPDWSAVKGDGIEFVIISTGDGKGTNPLWTSQAQGAQAVGIEVSLYHFLRFGVPPVEQAALMQSRWSEALANGIHPKRYWLDVEDTETKGTLDRVSWLKEIEAGISGIPSGVYTARWYWPEYMGNTAEFSHLLLWDAGYVPTEPTADGRPVSYGGWTEAAIWQWSSTGVVAGISGHVDMNVSYVAGEDEDMSLAEDLMIRVYVNVDYDQFDDGPPRPANSREEALTLAKYRMDTYHQAVFGMANNADSNMMNHLQNHPNGSGDHDHGTQYASAIHTHDEGETGPAQG